MLRISARELIRGEWHDDELGGKLSLHLFSGLLSCALISCSAISQRGSHFSRAIRLFIHQAMVCKIPPALFARQSTQQQLFQALAFIAAREKWRNFNSHTLCFKRCISFMSAKKLYAAINIILEDAVWKFDGTKTKFARDKWLFLFTSTFGPEWKDLWTFRGYF